jgi:hypothetical protein
VAVTTKGGAAHRALVPILFAILVLATLAAFGIAQKIKRTGRVLDRVQVTREMTPDGDGVNDVARVRFRLGRPDRTDVQIINSDDEVVRTLAFNRSLESYRFYAFLWDGFADTGVRAPSGPYRLRVVLREQGRTLTPSPKIELVRPDG